MEIKKFPGLKINQKLEQNNGKTKVTGNLKNWLQQAIKISQDSYASGTFGLLDSKSQSFVNAPIVGSTVFLPSA